MSTKNKTLSELELARRAGSTGARVQRLVDIGVLQPDGRGRFNPGDVQRVQAVAAYERGGIDLDDIARALRERRISFEYADRIFPEASPPSGRKLSELQVDIGQQAALLPDLFTALGLPRPTPERPLSEAEERIIPAFFDAWAASGMSSDAPLRAARLVGDAARRAVDGWVELFIEAIDLPPESRVTMSVDTLGPRMFEPATRVAQLLEPMTIWLLRSHLERALNALNVETMERALEAHGTRLRSPAEPPAIVFADLTGFTRLTEEQGDELAVHHASRLSVLAAGAAANHGGRLVKQLGDGVMLVFPRTGPAVDATLDLRHSAADAALPPLHIGISAGPVIERDGDYFGRTVNLASRISASAGPGEVLANETAAGAAQGVAVVPAGNAELKGFAKPIPLFRLEAKTKS